ncbi:MAG: flavin reductase family protein [Oscillospiraceae bacterium]|jgi:flavin reductase (DIM6/NTAB) family NADH-FMN oxidoreductase RutF|nr:flavin reductase family protein [Oscillospiraceae bacterium]
MANPLNKLTYGLYVTGVKNGEDYGGSIVDALIQAADSPALLVLSSMKSSNTNALIKQTGEFAVSVLPQDVDPFIIANFGFQSSRTVSKWANVPHTIKEGLPYLNCAAAQIRCKLVELKELGTHTLFFAEVIEASANDDSKSLSYEDYNTRLKTEAAKAFSEYRAKQK